MVYPQWNIIQWFKGMKYWYIAHHQWTLKTLSERSYTEKATYHIIPLIWNVQNSYSIETESRLVTPRARKDGEQWGWLLKYKSFLFKVIKIFRNWLWWWWQHNSVEIWNYWIVLKLCEGYGMWIILNKDLSKNNVIL